MYNDQFEDAEGEKTREKILGVLKTRRKELENKLEKPFQEDLSTSSLHSALSEVEQLEELIRTET